VKIHRKVRDFSQRKSISWPDVSFALKRSFGFHEGERVSGGFFVISFMLLWGGKYLRFWNRNCLKNIRGVVT